MIRTIQRIVFFFALAASVLIVREFLSIYNDLRQVDEYWGYAFLIFISLCTIYFVIVPFIKIFSIRRIHPPVNDVKDIDGLLVKRITALEKSRFITPLKGTDITPRQQYDEYIKILSAEVQKVRKVYVSRLFYSTTISQNGFLDALFILSASINLVKEIFIIYNGRTSNMDLFRLMRKVYTAMAIGGSETVEYATEEILQSITSDTIKSIPFIDKIAESLTDGFVNALMLTRISYIAENYCTKLYIEKDNQLLPSYKMVLETTRLLTRDVKEKIIWSFKKGKKSTEALIPDPALVINPNETAAVRQIGSNFLTRMFWKRYTRED